MDPMDMDLLIVRSLQGRTTPAEENWLRSGCGTPEQAAGYLACFCECGELNPARASRILAEFDAAPSSAAGEPARVGTAG